MIILTNDNYLHIKELQIDKQYQWRWYWSKCLNYIYNIWKNNWVIGVRLTVFSDNPAINLYKISWFNIVADRFDWKAYLMEKLIEKIK